MQGGQHSVLDNNVVADVVMDLADEKNESVFEDILDETDFDSEVEAKRKLIKFIEYRKGKYDGILTNEQLKNNMNILLKHANAVNKFLGPYVNNHIKKELTFQICGEHWDTIEMFNRDHKFLQEKKLIKLPLHYKVVVGFERVGSFFAQLIPFLKYLPKLKKMV